MHFEELSNEEWSLIAPTLCTQPLAGILRRGRPRIRPRVLANAILWVLTTGESWAKLPAHYPSQPTCRCRFEEWRHDGKLAEMIRILNEAGRQFSWLPDLPRPVVKAVPKRNARAIEEHGLPRVIWRSQASWQSWSDEAATPVSSALHKCAPRDNRSQRRTGDPLTHAPTRDNSNGAFWMGFAAKGTRVIDESGYVVYVSADCVPGAMFRGWTEIMRNGKRVARSGLVGPKFDAPEAAMRAALEWARRWIGRYGAPPEFELLHKAAG